jgi:hypothetical protein
MNSICKSKLEKLEEVQNFWTRQGNLSADEQVESRLESLQTFILQLERTPSGQAELKSRLKRFGPCQRARGEGAPQFYGRLRLWLDRTVG